MRSKYKQTNIAFESESTKNGEKKERYKSLIPDPNSFASGHRTVWDRVEVDSRSNERAFVMKDLIGDL